ncbi:MAG: hypothetical protein AVDCRST_MAG10-1858, partial [uncultured Acidimicrobiales bacterium]
DRSGGDPGLGVQHPGGRLADPRRARRPGPGRPRGRRPRRPRAGGLRRLRGGGRRRGRAPDRPGTGAGRRGVHVPAARRAPGDRRAREGHRRPCGVDPFGSHGRRRGVPHRLVAGRRGCRGRQGHRRVGRTGLCRQSLHRRCGPRARRWL